jgi:hypothetical protein
MLLNFGSTHNFFSEEATAHASLQHMSKGNMKVTVANSECVPCLGVYRATVFTISSEGFTTDFFALPLAGYDIVLGT